MEAEPKLYRPSNGTEGMDFTERFCDQCVHEEKYQRTQEGEDACVILSNSMRYEIDDPDYPKEWIYQNGRAVCTKFERVKDGN